MGIKLHFLMGYLEQFTKNLGHAKDEKGKRFQGVIKTIEKTY